MTFPNIRLNRNYNILIYNNLNLHVKIENTSLEMCNNSKLLGVIIDNCLSWNDHIEYLYKKSHLNLVFCIDYVNFCPSLF